MIAQLFENKLQVKNDLLSGLTVSLALVPEAVAFAFVAGVDPLVGLYAAFFMGIITAAFGGRPGMISGATGAMAVVMTTFVASFGLQYLFVAVILAGIFQMIVGLLKLGRFIRILPHPVMLGFVNGLAIVIGLAQFGQFKDNHRVAWTHDGGHGAAGGHFAVVGDWMNFGGGPMWVLIGLIVATMLIIHFLPRLTTAIPAPLVAIIVATLAVQFLPFLDTRTVRDVVDSQRVLQAEKNLKVTQFEAMKPNLKVNEVDEVATKLAAEPVSAGAIGVLPQGLQAGLPKFSIPDVDFGNKKAMMAVASLALILASIGLIESLMTLSLIDEMTETMGSTPRECYAQGAANITCGFFGGMGGCAMIGQSMINIKSGGRGRLSGISAAAFLLLLIIFAPGLIEKIPVASLIGVMFMVVIATFEWSSFRLFGKIPMADIFVIIAVSAVTVMHDLAIAVLVGVLISAIVHAWERSKDMKVEKRDQEDGSRYYHLDGHLYFGSISEFKELFKPVEDPDDVYLSFKGSRVCDHSAIEAVHNLSEKYRKLGKRLHLCDLSKECQGILSKAGDIVEGQYYGSIKGGGH